MKSLSAILDDASVLVVDETQMFQSALSHTTAATKFYSFADMFLGLGDVVTGDIREGKYSLVLLMVPPRCFISQKRYDACMKRMVGLYRTAVLCKVCAIMVGKDHRMKRSHAHDLVRTKQTCYAFHDSCRYNTAKLPSPVKGPIHGRWEIYTAWPVQHASCECTPGTVH